MSGSTISIDFSAPVSSHNKEIQRIFDDVLRSPIKKILRLETEVVGENKDTLLTFSLTSKSQMTIDRRMASEKKDVTQESIDQVIRICEKRLYDEIKKEVIEGIVNEKQRLCYDSLLYGMPFRVVNDIDIDSDAVVLLTQKKYFELLEADEEGRYRVFTR